MREASNTHRRITTGDVMRRFLRDEEGYQAWARAHPLGVVMPEKRAGAKLHHAHCHHVGYFNEQWGPGGRYGYTTKPMRCFDNAEEFRRWQTANPREVLPRCNDCAPAVM
jgi:hypothetical protein